MKLLLVGLITSCIFFECNAQVNIDLKGCWLPERFVLATIAKDSTEIDTLLYPVAGFVIFEEDTKRFIKDYDIKIGKRDIDNIILIMPFNSEINSILTEKKISENKATYILPFFYSYINMKYISRREVERFKKARVSLLKVQDRLLLQIKEDDKIQSIFFVNRYGDYEFKTIDESVTYLRSK